MSSSSLTSSSSSCSSLEEETHNYTTTSLQAHQMEPTPTSMSPSTRLQSMSTSSPTTISPPAFPSSSLNNQPQPELHSQTELSANNKHKNNENNKYYTRRLQVRKAQSHHRQRKKDYIKQLEREITAIRGMIDTARGEVEMLAKENQVMALRMKL